MIIVCIGFDFFNENHVTVYEIFFMNVMLNKQFCPESLPFDTGSIPIGLIFILLF